ncbi:UNVERIFIED_CONTAM: Beta-hexosaminidase 1 [Sesamum latifolium]|uniref:beta-N-acetylhexosaminidase n=1 Tax=Sesamum latifolium TaxID=2727402 RepID=A0AAW2TCY7_9LAMI
MTGKDAYQYFVLRAQEIAISLNWTPVNWEETFNAFPTSLNPRTVVHNWLGSGVCPKAVAKGITDVSEQKLVLGGEVCMWGETAASNVQKIWPRAAAAAERLWSNKESSRSPKSSVLPRLEYFRCLLTRRGVPVAPVRNFYARSLQRPGSCYEQ